MSFIVFFSSAAQIGTYKSYVITSAGGTFTTAPANVPDVIYLTVSTPTTLAANFSVGATSFPPSGTHWRVYFHLSNLNLNGYSINIFGQRLSQDQMLTNGYYDFWVVSVNGVQGLLYNYSPYDFYVNNAIYGGIIQDGTIQLSALAQEIPLTSLDTVGRGRILVGNSLNEISSYYAAGSGKILIGDGTDVLSKSVSGDISLSTTGVTSIDSVIVDADIKTGAAIKRQKLATGTASYVLVNSASGYMTEEATLNPLRGGLGTNASSSTGFVTFSSGSSSIGAITDVRGLDNLSFVTANQGTYYLYFPFAATATNINCRVTSDISAANDGLITIANNSGTVMTGSSLSAGVLTIAHSSVFGTGYSSTLTSNNTFAAGESLRLTTQKTTTGGVMHCDITYTRIN